MAYGKTVQDVFEKFLSDNDRKIAEGADRNIRMEQLKQQKKAQEQQAAMQRFNQAFQVMKAEEAQANRKVDLERQDQAIARSQANRAEDRKYALEDVMHKENFQNMDREDRQAHAMELQGMKDAQALKKAEIKANEPKKLKTVSEKTINELSDLKAAQNSTFADLDQMISKMPDTGPVVGTFEKYNPYDSDAQRFNNLANISRQMIGKYLEGGKLIGADEKKYERIMPKLGDTKDTLQNKMKNLQKMIDEKLKAQLGAMGKAGYDVEGIKGEFLPNSAAPQEMEAIDKELADIEAQLGELK